MDKDLEILAQVLEDERFLQLLDVRQAFIDAYGIMIVDASISNSKLDGEVFLQKIWKFDADVVDNVTEEDANTIMRLRDISVVTKYKPEYLSESEWEVFSKILYVMLEQHWEWVDDFERRIPMALKEFEGHIEKLKNMEDSA